MFKASRAVNSSIDTIALVNIVIGGKIEDGGIAQAKCLSGAHAG